MANSAAPQRTARELLLAWAKNPHDYQGLGKAIKNATGTEDVEQEAEWMAVNQLLVDYGSSAGEEMLGLNLSRANPLHPKRRQFKKLSQKERTRLLNQGYMSIGKEGQVAKGAAAALQSDFQHFKLPGLDASVISHMVEIAKEMGLDVHKLSNDAGFAKFAKELTQGSGDCEGAASQEQSLAPSAHDYAESIMKETVNGASS